MQPWRQYQLAAARLTYSICENVILCSDCADTQTGQKIPVGTKNDLLNVSLTKNRLINTLRKKDKNRKGKLYHPSIVCQHCQTAGPRSAVGRASDSRARGPGFDSRSCHILSFIFPLIQEGYLSVTGYRMCIKYWLIA